MIIGIPKEINQGEARVALTPKSATALQKLGYTLRIEQGAGMTAGFSDEAYVDAGVTLVKTPAQLWKEVDIILKVQEPAEVEQKRFQSGQTLISFLNPHQNADLLEGLKTKGTSALAMEMIPRISRAQKMDALSSMANIAGYRATIEAAHVFGRFLGGQMTAAGKIPPAKVLVIGAGVAGLAAIGALTSMGAVTYAFDVRPEVAEQIESLGAQFVFLDFPNEGQDGANTGGYAAPSSPEFREKQLEKFRALAPDMDIVIAAALIPGRDAPKLWLEDMVQSMKSGSVIVDLAAEKGGNCALTKRDEMVITDNGVKILGFTDFPSRMPGQASEAYATNLSHLLADLTPKKDGVLAINMEDDVIRGATVVHEGEITFPPPQPKIQAIAAAQPKTTPKLVKKPDPRKLERQKGLRQIGMITIIAAALFLVGRVAPPSFMQHLSVFVLAVFVGFQVIWNVSHALHTPLMSITNAISSIVIIGALIQTGETGFLIKLLAAICVGLASINIFGGFYVTRRMLQMFQRG